MSAPPPEPPEDVPPGRMPGDGSDAVPGDGSAGAPPPPRPRPGAPAGRRSPWSFAETPVTFTLIGACVIVWLLQLLTGDWIAQRFGFAAYWAAAEPYTALTTAFIHAGSMHMLFNMIGLLVFGTFLERYLGSGWFALLYLLSAWGGSLAVFVIAVADGSPQAVLTGHIGASGALFGLVGFIATPTRRLDRNLTGMLAFVAINIAIIWLLPNISWQAHLGGFVTGFILGCVHFFTPARVRTLAMLSTAALITAAGFAAMMLIPISV